MGRMKMGESKSKKSPTVTPVVKTVVEEKIVEVPVEKIVEVPVERVVEVHSAVDMAPLEIPELKELQESMAAMHEICMKKSAETVKLIVSKSEELQKKDLELETDIEHLYAEMANIRQKTDDIDTMKMVETKLIAENKMRIEEIKKLKKMLIVTSALLGALGLLGIIL